MSSPSYRCQQTSSPSKQLSAASLRCYNYRSDSRYAAGTSGSKQSGDVVLASCCCVHIAPRHVLPQVVDQLTAVSANDMTLLMYAARSGDKMTLKAVVKWCRRVMGPSQVRELIRQRDADGLTFYMHAANAEGEFCRKSADTSSHGRLVVCVPHTRKTKRFRSCGAVCEMPLRFVLVA